MLEKFQQHLSSRCRQTSEQTLSGVTVDTLTEGVTDQSQASKLLDEPNFEQMKKATYKTLARHRKDISQSIDKSHNNLVLFFIFESKDL